MAASIAACLAAFAALVWMLRRDRVSLGLPAAYLFGLLLIHVPGAVAHLVGGAALRNSDLTELGIGFTALGAVCFVAGVWFTRPPPGTRAQYFADRRRFSWFCLGAGWFFTYGLSFLGRVPSLGAAIEKGGAVWMLGAMIGLRGALDRGKPRETMIWLATLAVYPVLMLLFGGFLSYGATATIVVLSVLAISIRSNRRVVASIALVSVVAFNVFLNYFPHREEIRDAVWGGAALEERIDVSLNVFRDFQWFDPADQRQLESLDRRLNQNYFAGLAAERIKNGDVDYLYGRSLWEGLLALVPRAVWPDKPVYAGSGEMVGEMTGLVLSETTSFGVGNVMEFYVNFGVPGVIGGFLCLGWLIGTLDRKAAAAEATGDLTQVFRFFLPAVALIQPNGSLVELASGSAAALAAAYLWSLAWAACSGSPQTRTGLPERRAFRSRATAVVSPIHRVR